MPLSEDDIKRVRISMARHLGESVLKRPTLANLPGAIGMCRGAGLGDLAAKLEEKKAELEARRRKKLMDQAIEIPEISKEQIRHTRVVLARSWIEDRLPDWTGGGSLSVNLAELSSICGFRASLTPKDTLGIAGYFEESGWRVTFDPRTITITYPPALNPRKVRVRRVAPIRQDSKRANERGS